MYAVGEQSLRCPPWKYHNQGQSRSQSTAGDSVHAVADRPLRHSDSEDSEDQEEDDEEDDGDDDED